MTKGQKVGVFSIIAGVMLFVPLLFWALVIAGVDQFTNFRFYEGMTYLRWLREMGSYGAPWHLWGMWLGTILLIIFSVTAIIVGVVMCCKKMENFARFPRIDLIVAGVVAVLTFVFTVVMIGEARSINAPVYDPAFGPFFDIGFGAIFMLVVGLVTIVLASISDKIFKDSKGKEFAKVSKVNDNVKKGDDFDSTVARLKQYKEDGIIDVKMYKEKIKVLIEKMAEEI